MKVPAEEVAPDLIAIHDRELEAIEEWALAAFYGDLGISAIFWQQVSPAIATGPFLLVVAAVGGWPPVRPRRDAIYGVMQAIPADRDTMSISPAYLRGGGAADMQLCAALYKQTLETAVELGMSCVRYEVDARNAAVRRVLAREGFVPAEGDDERVVALEADAKELLGGLGLAGRPVRDFFGGGFGAGGEIDRLTCFQSVLQLGGVRRPPGVVGNPVGSEPGTPDPPDGGTPTPSPTPDGGTPTVGSEPGTP